MGYDLLGVNGIPGLPFFRLIPGCLHLVTNYSTFSLHRRHTQTNPEISDLLLGRTPEFGDLYVIRS